jgi:hypothetical protein
MKKVLLLLLILTFGYTTSTEACEYIQFSIDFSDDVEIPEEVNYILFDNNGVQEGFITIAGESNVPFTLCVEGPCFALTISSEEMLQGVEDIFASLNSGFFYSDVYAGDDGFSIEGCIEYFNDCPDEPLYVASDCQTGIFEIGSFVDGEEVFWDFGDGTTEQGGHFTTHDYAEPGVYTVCGFYTAPNCQGASFCGVVEIEDCGSPCEIEIEVFEQVECGAYHCGIYGEFANEFDWYLDGVLYWDSGNFMVVYLEDLGEHTLCAVYENDECGQVETCITLVAEGCEETCTDVQFGMLNLTEEINYVEWNLSGPGETLAEGVAQYDGFGTEWIDLCIDEGCYYFEVYSPEGLFTDDNFSLSMQGLSGPVEWLSTVSTSEYIGFEFCVGPTLVYPEVECPSWLWSDVSCDVTAFEIGSFQEGEIAIWNFGDGTIETGGHFIEHVFEEEGWVTICVNYSSDYCEGVEVCIDLYINPCEPCPTEINIESNSDCLYTFNLEGANPDSSTVWNLDGNYLGETFEGLELQIQQPGWHTICADYSFVGCWEIICTEFYVEGCLDDCPIDIYAEINSNCLASFWIEGANDQSEVFWILDDEYLGLGDSFYEVMVYEEGWHTICAEYIDENCNGFFCTEFYSNGCDGGCNFDIYAETSGCYGYFFVAGLPDFADVLWTIGDVEFETTINTGLSWDFLEDGWYQVCAEFSLQECGSQYICQEIYVENCNGGNCEAELAILGNDGCVSEIRVDGISTDIPIAWSFNDVYFSNNNNYWFGYDYPEDGWYTICAEFYTEECGGVVLCEEVYIQGCNNDCYLDGFVETFGCGEFILKLYGNNEFQLFPDVFLDGEYYDSGWATEFILEPGEHVICGLLPGTEFCETLEICFDVIAEDCDCPTEISADVNGCITIFDVNQIGGEVTYTVFGDGYQESFSGQNNIFTWLAPQNGLYEVCAYYESEICEGISLCTVFEITGCSDEVPCEMEFQYTSGEDGYYFFEATNNQDAPNAWYVNGEYIETGNAFDWTFDEPGSYEVCAAIETEVCPEGITTCINIFVPEDDNCTEVTIIIDVEGDLLEDFDIAFELDGLDFPFGGDFTIYENCGSTIISFCVPDGCYEMTMSLEEFLEVALLFELFVDGGIEYEYVIDPLTQTVTIEFGINTDCSTGILENETQTLAVYPIPSNAQINVQHAMSNASWRIFDAQGRMVENGTTKRNQLLTIDIQSYASGTYVIQLIGEDSTLQERFQKVN